MKQITLLVILIICSNTILLAPMSLECGRCKSLEEISSYKSDAIYPVVELDVNITGVVGKTLVLVLTAFSINDPITVMVSFRDTVSNGTFRLYTGTFDYLVNDEIIIDCSSLSVSQAYEMIIGVEDSLLQYTEKRFFVVLDVVSPSIEYFYSNVPEFDYGESIEVEYLFIDDNFAYADLYIDDELLNTGLFSKSGVFTLSYLLFDLPSTFTSYLFTVRAVLFDFAGNNATTSFNVKYNDIYVRESPEDRRIRLNRIGINAAVIVIVVLIAMAGLLYVNRKGIKNRYYSGKPLSAVNE